VRSASEYVAALVLAVIAFSLGGLAATMISYALQSSAPARSVVLSPVSVVAKSSSSYVLVDVRLRSVSDTRVCASLSSAYILTASGSSASTVGLNPNWQASTQSVCANPGEVVSASFLFTAGSQPPSTGYIVLRFYVTAGARGFYQTLVAPLG